MAQEFKQKLILEADASSLLGTKKSVDSLSDSLLRVPKSKMSQGSALTGGADPLSDEREKYKELYGERRKLNEKLRLAERASKLEGELFDKRQRQAAGEASLSDIRNRLKEETAAQFSEQKKRAVLEEGLTSTEVKLKAARKGKNADPAEIERLIKVQGELKLALTASLEKEQEGIEKTRRLRLEEAALEKETGKLRSEVTKGELSFGRLSREMDRTGIDTKDLSGETRRLTEEQKRLGVQLDETGKKLDHVSDKAGRSGLLGGDGRMAALAGAASALAGTGLSARMFQGPITSGMDFEKSMSRLEALALGDIENRAERESLKARLRSQALELGATTSFSPTEVVAGQTVLGAAGLKPEEILTATKSLLSAAKAADVTLDQAANVTTGVLMGFELPVEKLKDVSDILTFTAVKSKTDVLELGEAFKYVASTSRELFGSTEDSVRKTASAFAILADSNIRGSEAGTALRASLSRLAAPTGQAAEYISSLGIQTKDQAGNLLEFSSIIENISTATKNLSKSEKVEVIKEIVGMEAMSAFLTILGKVDKEGVSRLRSLEAEMKNATGISERMAAIMGDNTAGKLEEFRGAAEDFSIAFSETILPTLTEFLKVGTGMLNQLSALSREFPTATKYIGLTAISLLSLLSVGGSVLLFMGSLRFAATQLGLSLGTAGLLGSLGRVVPLLTTLGRLLMLHPVGRIVGLTAAGVGLLAMAGDDDEKKNEEKLRKAEEASKIGSGGLEAMPGRGEPRPGSSQLKSLGEMEQEQGFSRTVKQTSNKNEYTIMVNVDSREGADIAAQIKDAIEQIERQRERELRSAYAD